eukprot:m.392846 g.392846  ORF g.392846 m.392846 type:complete len:91 (-) comp235435_c0_seq1:102-374(-)
MIIHSFMGDTRLRGAIYQPPFSSTQPVTLPHALLTHCSHTFLFSFRFQLNLQLALLFFLFIYLFIFGMLNVEEEFSSCHARSRVWLRKYH